MSFFKKHNEIKYLGYQALNDILKQEQDLSLYVNKVNIIIKHEQYIDEAPFDLDEETE